MGRDELIACALRIGGVSMFGYDNKSIMEHGYERSLGVGERGSVSGVQSTSQTGGPTAKTSGVMLARPVRCPVSRWSRPVPAREIFITSS